MDESTSKPKSEAAEVLKPGTSDPKPADDADLTDKSVANEVSPKAEGTLDSSDTATKVEVTTGGVKGTTPEVVKAESQLNKADQSDPG